MPPREKLGTACPRGVTYFCIHLLFIHHTSRNPAEARQMNFPARRCGLFFHDAITYHKWPKGQPKTCSRRKIKGVPCPIGGLCHRCLCHRCLCHRCLCHRYLHPQVVPFLPEGTEKRIPKYLRYHPRPAPACPVGTTPRHSESRVIGKKSIQNRVAKRPHNFAFCFLSFAS